MISPNIILDTIGPLLGRLIPDSNARMEAMTQVRLAIVASDRRWTPQAIVGLVDGVSLVIYLSVVGWVGPLLGIQLALIWDVLILMGAILAMAWGVDVLEVVKVMNQIRKETRVQPK